MATYDVSAGRKALNTIGIILSIVGFVLFLSVFLSAMAPFGDSGRFQSNIDPPIGRAVLGMVLFVAGGVVRGLGLRGLAGSGVVLDPQQARRDLEPWSRMTGGMIKDAVEEAGLAETLGAIRGSGGGGDLPFDERLRRLHGLYTDGILSETEYEREKQELLDRN